MTSFHYSANIQYSLDPFRKDRILPGPRGSKIIYIMLGRSHRFLGIYQYFGEELKASLLSVLESEFR